jgi:hypothetical protein
MTKASTKSSPVASSRHLLDAASARKLDLEARLLEEQLTPAHRRRENLKTIAGASGLVIAFATVIGGLLSIFSWFAQQNRDREVRIEERMSKALALLSEERPTQRAAAISSLQSFLASSDEKRNSQRVAFGGE